MRTYYISVGMKDNIEIRAENIDNLRRNLIRDYDAEMKAGKRIWVQVLVGPKYGAHYEILGDLSFYKRELGSYGSAPTGYYWLYRRDGTLTMARVSPKTGRLLDMDRLWGRMFRCRITTPSHGTAPDST